MERQDLVSLITSRKGAPLSILLIMLGCFSAESRIPVLLRNRRCRCISGTNPLCRDPQSHGIGVGRIGRPRSINDLS